jgi:hypothetical protein
MKLPSGVLRYLLIAQTAIPILFNVAIPLTLGWLTFRTQPSVVTWALDKGAVADFIGTCYLLPAITCLIATPIVRSHAARGMVSRVPAEDVPRLLLFYRGGLIWRATKWGLTGLTLLSAPVFFAFKLLADETIPTMAFLAVKIAFAVLLGCVVTPLISLVALTDKSSH